MIDVIDFGLTREGERVQLYTLQNKNGLKAKLLRIKVSKLCNYWV